jgi:signal transduction histidine kinase
MTVPPTLHAPAGANDSLVEAKRLVLMGQIASGVSHELNNLLGKIIGLAEMTMDEVADHPDACAELETLISVAEQGAGLVGRLEACSGWNIAEPGRFDLAALVEGASAAAEARRPGLRHVREIPAEPYWIMADAALLRVALDAVLDNASRWGATRIVVLCRALPAVAGVREAEIVVRDDGTGMAPEVLARAFEPFFTTRPPREAAGAGLSLARAAMSECGGRIEAESSPGEGTMVRLTLPMTP